MLGVGQTPEADEAEHMRFDLSLSDLLADGDVRPGATIAGQGRKLSHGTLETRRLGQAAALETEDCHRDLPAGPRLADEVAILVHGARQEDLAELTAPCHLPDPPYLDATLMHVDEE